MKIDGILIINKPQGITSHDCVDQVRKIFKTRKVGHTGTLDPDAVGVLPICINKATKIAQYITANEKEYYCRVKLGFSTTTEDASGEIVKEKKIDRIITKEECVSALNQLLNLNSQIPPMYSSVKVNGKKLYEYARQGIEIEREPRAITVYQVEMEGEIINNADGTVEFCFSILGSKGIYIRTICVTIGQILGYPSHMSYLKRNSVGKFNIAQAIDLDKLTINSKCISVEEALDFETIKVDQLTAFKVKNGAAILNIYDIFDKVTICDDSRVIAIYEVDQKRENWLKAVKVL